MGKNKLHHFWPALEKFWKNPLVPPLEKSFRRPCWQKKRFLQAGAPAARMCQHSFFVWYFNYTRIKFKKYISHLIVLNHNSWNVSKKQCFLDYSQIIIKYLKSLPAGPYARTHCWTFPTKTSVLEQLVPQNQSFATTNKKDRCSHNKNHPYDSLQYFDKFSLVAVSFYHHRTYPGCQME